MFHKEMIFPCNRDFSLYYHSNIRYSLNLLQSYLLFRKLLDIFIIILYIDEDQELIRIKNKKLHVGWEGTYNLSFYKDPKPWQNLMYTYILLKHIQICIIFVLYCKKIYFYLLLDEDNIFLVGTDEGMIYLATTQYSSEVDR